MTSQDDPRAKELAALMAFPYSVDTQSQIARLLNKDADNPTHNVASEEHFEGILMFLSLISSKSTGHPMTLSHSLASGMIARFASQP